VSPRRLSVPGVFASLNQTTAPNLIHLSPERAYSALSIPAQTVLDVLRGYLQLETVLINVFSAWWDEVRSYTPVTLPMLRSIELDHGEVFLDLAVSLRFSPVVAMGFRGIFAARKSAIQIHTARTVGDRYRIHLSHISDTKRIWDTRKEMPASFGSRDPRSL